MLIFMGKRKSLPKKCPAEYGEKGGAIFVTSMGPRVPREVTALPPSSVAVFGSSNSPVLCLVYLSVGPCLRIVCEADSVK